MSKSLFEELSEFADELVILLKEDWEKTKKFVREHKKYFLWLFALFIGAQFTDIMTLGKSWDAYCKKNGIQNGGSEGNPAQASTTTTEAKEAKAALKSQGTSSTDASVSETDTKNTKKDGKKKGIRKNMAQSLRRNPVFGNMNHIFNMTTSMFSLALFLLAIVGILSLPVIIFIIITYCVIKSLLNRLAIL